MQVWLVDHPTSLDEFASPSSFTLSRDTSPTRFKLYRNALSLLDSSSQERVRLFYHRADSCRMCPPTLPRLSVEHRRSFAVSLLLYGY